MRNDRQAERDKDSDLVSELGEPAIHGAICLAVSLLDRNYCTRQEGEVRENVR